MTNQKIKHPGVGVSIGQVNIQAPIINSTVSSTVVIIKKGDTKNKKVGQK